MRLRICATIASEELATFHFRILNSLHCSHKHSTVYQRHKSAVLVIFDLGGLLVGSFVISSAIDYIRYD